MKEFPEWLTIMGIAVIIWLFTAILLFGRTTVARINKFAKKDNVYPLATLQVTSASEIMQYALAFTLSEKYAQRMAKNSHLKLNELIRYHKPGDIWKAKSVIFSTIGLAIFVILCMIFT